MALFGGNQPDALDLIQWDAENRAKAYEGLKRSGDLPALGMVFGLNMLGNSQNMGFGQALGNAGLDALQQHKAIMKARRDAINTDLDRQTTLKRAQEDLNRRDRDYEFGLQKWDYQKEQDAIQNQLARQRVAMEGARIAMARAEAEREAKLADEQAARDAEARQMLMQVLGIGQEPAADPTPVITQFNANGEPIDTSAAETAPATATAPGTTSGTGGGINLTPEQINGLTQVAALGSGEAAKAAKTTLDLYYKQQQAQNGRYQFRDGVRIDTFTGMAEPILNRDGTPYQTPQMRKEEAEADKAEKAAKASRDSAMNDALVQLRSIDHAIELAEKNGILLDNTGLGGALLSNLPGTDAYALDAELQTIRSGAMMSALAGLKAASPTGASGLGALSENEGKMLQASQGNLDQKQDRKMLVRNLKAIRERYARVLRAYGTDYGYSDEEIGKMLGTAPARQAQSGNGNKSQGGKAGLDSFFIR